MLSAWEESVPIGEVRPQHLEAAQADTDQARDDDDVGKEIWQDAPPG